MEIKINQLSDATQEIEVNLGYSEILFEIEEAYNEGRKNIAIDGFRKGKAPITMIKKLFGEAIEYKASEKIATKKFWDVVEQENLKPISTPQLTDINFEMGSKLFFKVKYEIKPKLELKDFKNLEIEKPVFKVKEEDIQKEIDFLLKQHQIFEPAEVIEDKNFRITVNLQRIDAAALPIVGQRSENMLLDLSDDKVNPQISQNALNKKVGDTFPFQFMDEHKHGEELHREEFSYTIEISKIEKIISADINEDLIKKVSGDKASTIKELYDQLKNNFKDYYTKQSEEIFSNNLLNEVVKNNDFIPPPGYVDSIHKRLIEIEMENAKRHKSNIPDENVLSEYYKPRAVWNAKWQIIMENIAELESIKIDDAELEELAKEEAEKTGISVTKLMKYYKDTNRSDVLLEDKVIKFLKDNNKTIEVNADEKLKEKKEQKNES